MQDIRASVFVIDFFQAGTSLQSWP